MTESLFFFLNPRIIYTHLLTLSSAVQAPNSPSPINVCLTSLPSPPLLVTCYHRILPLNITILGVSLFPLSFSLFSGSFIEDFEFWCSSLRCFLWGCLCILFSMGLNDLLWIQFNFFFFLNGFFFVIWNKIFLRERLWICLRLCVFFCFFFLFMVYLALYD